MEETHNKASYTQIKSYREHVLSGELGSQRDRIMRLFWSYDKQGAALCREEIVRLTGIPINAVSGRVATLKQGGYLRVKAEAESPYSNKIVEFLAPVKPVPPTPQLGFSEFEAPFVEPVKSTEIKKHSPSCFVFGIDIGQRKVCTCGADPSLAP